METQKWTNLGKFFSEYKISSITFTRLRDESAEGFNKHDVCLQSFWLATRGGVANWCYTFKKKLPPSLPSTNHWLCSRDKWAGGTTIAGKILPWIKHQSGSLSCLVIDLFLSVYKVYSSGPKVNCSRFGGIFFATVLVNKPQEFHWCKPEILEKDVTFPVA